MTTTNIEYQSVNDIHNLYEASGTLDNV